MDMKSQLVNLDDHIRSSIAGCHPLLTELSAPLFAVDSRNRPDLFATCVAISLNGRIYLVTAAHAVCQIERAGSEVHVGKKQILVVPSKFFRTSVDGEDPLDVATVEISAEFAKKVGISIVEESQLMVRRYFENPHFYCMHGYPLTKNKPFKSINAAKKVVNTYAFTFAGAENRNPDYRHNSRSEHTHIGLSYQLGKNEEGAKVNLPKPKGMSGGGLWIVPNSFESSLIFLGGILIEHHRKNILATRIEKIVELLNY